MTAASRAPGEALAQKVFICYRRDETAAHAGRLYDAMVSRFGEENVFMDVDLPPGVDFEQRITEVVSSCVVLLVVMGPSWATATGEDGSRRLDDPADFVRLEVETGLQRTDVTPIPVLVGGARMPRREDLPGELRPIARRNAIEMSDGRWGYDVGRLMTALDGLLPDDGAPAVPAEPPPSPQTLAQRLRLAIEGMLVGGATAAIAGFLAYSVPTSDDRAGESPLETAWHIAAEMLRRGWTLAIVGVALASWLAYRIGRADSERSPGLQGLRIGLLAGALSGLIWGLLAFLPKGEIEFTPKSEYELAAIAVSGGLIGYLIGTAWRPRRPGPALACGAVGGLLFQAIVIASQWKNNASTELIALSWGLGTAVVVGLPLIAMLVLDRRESRRGAAGLPQAAAGSPRSG